MSVRFLFVLAIGLAFAAPATAVDPPKKPDPAEAILASLFNQTANLGEANINDIPMFELLQKMSKTENLAFVINDEAFRAGGVQDFKEMKPRVAATQLRGIASTHQFLTLTLDSVGATYLIKGGVIEIVPVAYAAKVTKSATHPQDEGGRVELVEPLVSVILKEKPLNEAVTLIAERYDLNVIVSPQAGDAKTGFVNARLLNVPADKALDLLAVQADLRVVRKGNAFLITSREHADNLFNEKLEKERQKIELEKFRAAPPPRPQPEPKPEPKPADGVIILKGEGFQIPLQVKPQLKPEPKPQK